MTATAITDTGAAAPTVGELRELARYTTATGTERVLGGQRVDGVVVLTDYALAAVSAPTSSSKASSRKATERTPRSTR